MDESFTNAVGSLIGEKLRVPKTSALRFASMPYNTFSGSGTKMVNALIEIQKHRDDPPPPEIDPTIQGFPTIANQSRGMMTAPLVNQIAKDRIFSG